MSGAISTTANLSTPMTLVTWDRLMIPFCWIFGQGICCGQAPHVFQRLCLKPPRGVLLHGPPGTGKTALACAAAADAGATLFVLNGPDIISEYVGESEIGLQVGTLALSGFFQATLCKLTVYVYCSVIESGRTENNIFDAIIIQGSQC